MKKNLRIGLSTGILAYVTWGILPIYWKSLEIVPPLELLAWRVLGCAIVAWGIILLRGRLAPRKIFTPKVIGLLAAASFLIALNWTVFIWAVATNRILQATLGYFISPLVSVLFGMLFFSESLGFIRLLALLFALAGLILMTFASGVFPWISLVLACTFSSYGLVVKVIPPVFDSIEILAWITVLLGPLAAVFLAFAGIDGNWHISGFGFLTTILLILAGAVTLLPLWLFGIGARHLPLGIVGFLQYIAPVIMFLIGVLLYSEALGTKRALAFLLVAAALLMYSSTLRKS